MSNGLVWDDHILIEKNQSKLAEFSLRSIFFSDFWSTETDEGSSHYYRPLVTLSYCLDYLRSGVEPFGYHLTNILVHTCIVVLMWFLLIEIGVGTSIATLSTALFAVHPSVAESVAWVSGRTDLLATMWMLVSIIACLYALKGKQQDGRLRWLALLACAAGLLSKESALVTPLLVVVVCISSSRSAKRLDSIIRGFILLVGGWLLLRALVLESMTGAGESEGASPVIATLSLLHLWGNLLWPPLFRIEYGSGLSPSTLMSGAIVGGIALGSALWLALAREVPRVVKTLSQCALIAFIPSVLAVVLRSMIGSRLVYTSAAFYLPSIGLFLLKGNYSKRMRGLIVGIIVLLSLGTLQRASLWKSDQVLFTEALKAKEASTRNHLNLGIALYNSGDIPGALNEFSTPMEPAAQDQQHYMLSLIYTAVGCERDAERELRAALTVKPDNYSAAHNLAGLLGTQGRLSDARNVLLQVSQRFPAYRERALRQLKVLENLAPQAQRPPSNTAACTDAATLAAFLATPLDLNRRAGELLRAQHTELAEVLVKAALRVDPNFIPARLNLAQIYVLQQNLSSARETIQTILDLNPGEERARNLLKLIDGRT